MHNPPLLVWLMLAAAVCVVACLGFVAVLLLTGSLAAFWGGLYKLSRPKRKQ
jgi:hypothetical protein